MVWTGVRLPATAIWSTSTLRSNQPSIQWEPENLFERVKRPGRDADNSEFRTPITYAHQQVELQKWLLGLLRE